MAALVSAAIGLGCQKHVRRKMIHVENGQSTPLSFSCAFDSSPVLGARLRMHNLFDSVHSLRILGLSDPCVKRTAMCNTKE